jgi:hypothetical protein
MLMTVVVRMDTALYRMARFYHREFTENNPGVDVGMGVIVMGTLRALEDNGDAEKHVDADGGVTFRATPKFLAQMGGEPGPLVTFGPDVN